MSATSKLPTNKNFLSPLGFKFTIYKTPNLNYFVQGAAIPSMSMGRVSPGTPFNRLQLHGDKIDWSDLTITFRVDEELRNYYELYRWMEQIGKPDNFQQYSSIAAAATSSGEGIYSDATLTILSSSKTPIVEINFRNLFPIALSELNFSTQLNDVDYVDCIASFAYERFSITYL